VHWERGGDERLIEKASSREGKGTVPGEWFWTRKRDPRDNTPQQGEIIHFVSWGRGREKSALVKNQLQAGSGGGPNLPSGGCDLGREPRFWGRECRLGEKTVTLRTNGGKK